MEYKVTNSHLPLSYFVMLNVCQGKPKTFHAAFQSQSLQSTSSYNLSLSIPYSRKLSHNKIKSMNIATLLRSDRTIISAWPPVTKTRG